MKKNSRMLKRLLSGALVLAFVGVPLLSTGAVAEEAFDWESYLDWTDDEIPTEFGEGVSPYDKDDWEETLREHQNKKIGARNVATYSLTDSLPESVDLSQTIYFPNVRTQGELGSCYAFSSTYYQFTYEVNRLNSTSGKLMANTYSPSWVYYGTAKTNGNTVDVDYADIYAFLSEHGAMKWHQNIYLGSLDSTMPWPTDKDLMREALFTRLVDFDAIVINDAISSNDDVDLNEIKSAINSGKVLRTTVSWDFASNLHDTNREKTIFYRCGADGIGHSVIVVGYDDSITFDINADGLIEEAERGAFKVANSWGPGWGTNGYFWVMYDALNEVSCLNDSDWDATYDNERVAAFSFKIESVGQEEQEWTDCIFHSITVEKKTPRLLVEFELDSSNMMNTEIDLRKKSSTDTTTRTYNTSYCRFTYSTTTPRTLIFDYDSSYNNTVFLSNGIGGIIGQNVYWGISVASAPASSVNDQVNYAKLTDDSGNLIRAITKESNNPHIHSCNLALKYGDLNYDGILSADDVSLIMDYVANNVTFSNMQLLLADYNCDGKVSLLDATALNAAIS